MQCNIVREQINQIVGEGVAAHPLRRLAVAAHLFHCPSCRQEWRRLKRLQDLAENLPAPPLPADMKARVMAATAPFPYAPNRKGFNLMQTSILTGIGICAVSAAFLLLAPHSPKNGEALADDMHKALAKMNTFHLKGWKLEDGKRTPWEIWGSRRPFFYRERRGAFETLDNGTERYLIFAPNPAEKSKGVILKLASNPTSADMGWDFSELERWTYANPHQVHAKTAAATTYSLKNSFVLSQKPIQTRNLYTFRNGSSLPHRYETFHARYRREPADLHAPDKADIEAQWTGAQLEIEYDNGAAANIQQFAQLPNYQLVDAVEDAKAESVPRENAQTKNGLTLQANPIATDSAGNVVVVVQGWLGSHSLSNYEIPFHFRSWLPGTDDWFTPQTSHGIARDREYIYCRDDQGRDYIKAQTTYIPYGSLAIWLLIPREPLKSDQALPRQLNMTVFGDMTQTVKVSGSDVNVSQEVLSDAFQITASLPNTITEIDFDKLNRLYPDHSVNNSNGFPEMEEIVAYTRAHYFDYVALKTRMSEPNASETRKRAVYWLSEGLKTEKNEMYRKQWTKTLQKYREEIAELEKAAK